MKIMGTYCSCEPEINSLCVYCQRKPTPHTDEKGYIGQDIWYLLEKHGFVGNEGANYKLTPLEEKIKKWLIWGRKMTL